MVAKNTRHQRAEERKKIISSLPEGWQYVDDYGGEPYYYYTPLDLVLMEAPTQEDLANPEEAKKRFEESMQQAEEEKKQKEKEENTQKENEAKIQKEKEEKQREQEQNNTTNDDNTTVVSSSSDDPPSIQVKPKAVTTAKSSTTADMIAQAIEAGKEAAAATKGNTADLQKIQDEALARVMAHAATAALAHSLPLSPPPTASATALAPAPAPGSTAIPPPHHQLPPASIKAPSTPTPPSTMAHPTLDSWVMNDDLSVTGRLADGTAVTLVVHPFFPLKGQIIKVIHSNECFELLDPKPPKKAHVAKKRAAGSKSNTINQMKDATVRQAADVAARKVQNLQSMMTYNNKAMQERCPKSDVFLIHRDCIVERPSDNQQGLLARDDPHYSVLAPPEGWTSAAQRIKVGEYFEEVGKLLQQSDITTADSKRKLSYVNTPEQYLDNIFGKKVKKN